MKEVFYTWHLSFLHLFVMSSGVKKQLSKAGWKIPKFILKRVMIFQKRRDPLSLPCRIFPKYQSIYSNRHKKGTTTSARHGEFHSNYLWHQLLSRFFCAVTTFWYYLTSHKKGLLKHSWDCSALRMHQLMACNWHVGICVIDFILLFSSWWYFGNLHQPPFVSP